MNHDPFRESEVPVSLKPYFRRLMIAFTDDEMDIDIEPKATGYCYIGWIKRGFVKAYVDDVLIYNVADEGRVFLSGQIDDAKIRVRFSGRLIYILGEFTALGQHLLMGVAGAENKNDIFRSKDSSSANLRSIEKTLESFSSGMDREEVIAAFVGSLQDLTPHTLRLPDYLHAAVEYIESHNGFCRIGEVADAVNISARQLRREFHRSVGLSPKNFCGLLQVNTALFALLNQSPLELSTLALDCGFSDQAHLTHAFQKFLGESPLSMANNIEATIARFVGQCRSSKRPPNND